jgi:methyl-accepting chemotaxis protein
VALALGLAFAWRVTRSITEPIGDALQVARAVADGDLTHNISSTQRDEMGQLLTAMARARLSTSSRSSTASRSRPISWH